MFLNKRKLFVNILEILCPQDTVKPFLVNTGSKFFRIRQYQLQTWDIKPFIFRKLSNIAYTLLSFVLAIHIKNCSFQELFRFLYSNVEFLWYLKISIEYRSSINKALPNSLYPNWKKWWKWKSRNNLPRISHFSFPSYPSLAASFLKNDIRPFVRCFQTIEGLAYSPYLVVPKFKKFNNIQSHIYVYKERESNSADLT